MRSPPYFRGAAWFAAGMLFGKALSLAILFFFCGACGGDAFSGAAAVDAAAAADAGPTLPDGEPAADAAIAVDGDGSSSLEAGTDAAIAVDGAAGDVHAAADAGDAFTGHDASSDNDAGMCTPVTYIEPPTTTCACFFAGSCPVDGGPTSCLWAETPLTITGQPTCRGCGKITFKPNPCGRCKETFSCACLAAYLDPGQRCCDGPGGPYLSDYACP